MDDGSRIPALPYGTFSERLHARAAAGHTVIKAQLELTYRCNLHCRHCYTDPFNRKDYLPRELTREEIERLLDEMQHLGIVWLNLTGGDIFMHPEFFAIYESARNRGFLLQLYTNGTLFTKAVVDRLAAYPPFTIDISCHSVREERFEWFTQVPGSYRAFLRGLDLLRQAGLPFTLKTKVMSWNADEVEELKRFTESWGQPFTFTTSLSPRLDGDCSSLAYRVNASHVRELARPTGDAVSIDACDEDAATACAGDDRLYRCGCATNTIHISAFGELGTCTMEYEHRRSVRSHSLQEAIRLVFEAVRAARYQTPSVCRSCTLVPYCDKKPTEARWEQGSTEDPIPYACDVALARAQTVTHQPLLHPLRMVHS